MTIGDRIKKIRTEKGLSTYALSKKAGISQSTVSKLENGKRKADNIILEKLADALNVSVDRLTGDSVSCIIESKLDELGISLQDLSQKSGVPFTWLKNIDSFIPRDMDYMLEAFDPTPGRPLDWDDTVGYKSYEWITNVAEVLGIPGSTLRAALARQEIPVYDGPRITVEEAKKKSLKKFFMINKLQNLLMLT